MVLQPSSWSVVRVGSLDCVRAPMASSVLAGSEADEPIYTVRKTIIDASTRYYLSIVTCILQRSSSRVFGDPTVASMFVSMFLCYDKKRVGARRQRIGIPQGPTRNG